MHQVEETLERHYMQQRPLKRKWKVRSDTLNPKVLSITYDGKLILKYDTKYCETLYGRYSSSVEQDGYNAALLYLELREPEPDTVYEEDPQGCLNLF